MWSHPHADMSQHWGSALATTLNHAQHVQPEPPRCGYITNSCNDRHMDREAIGWVHGGMEGAKQKDGLTPVACLGGSYALCLIAHAA